MNLMESLNEEAARCHEWGGQPHTVLARGEYIQYPMCPFQGQNRINSRKFNLNSQAVSIYHLALYVIKADLNQDLINNPQNFGTALGFEVKTLGFEVKTLIDLACLRLLHCSKYFMNMEKKNLTKKSYGFFNFYISSQSFPNCENRLSRLIVNKHYSLHNS